MSKIIKKSLVKVDKNTYRINTEEKVPSGTIYQRHLEIVLEPDGAIEISDDDIDSFIYLYKDEVDYLKEILEKRK
jgi:hypothetical protein